jgi:hypothetical protein
VSGGSEGGGSCDGEFGLSGGRGSEERGERGCEEERFDGFHGVERLRVEEERDEGSDERMDGFRGLNGCELML